MAKRIPGGNRRHSTKISEGYNGSVFDRPLSEGDYGSEWLEHLHDSWTPDESFFWTMTYHPDGRPKISVSTVLTEAALDHLADWWIERRKAKKAA